MTIALYKFTFTIIITILTWSPNRTRSNFAKCLKVSQLRTNVNNYGFSPPQPWNPKLPLIFVLIYNFGRSAPQTYGNQFLTTKERLHALKTWWPVVDIWLRSRRSLWATVTDRLYDDFSTSARVSWNSLQTLQTENIFFKLRRVPYRFSQNLSNFSHKRLKLSTCTARLPSIAICIDSICGQPHCVCLPVSLSVPPPLCLFVRLFVCLSVCLKMQEWKIQE